MDIKIWILLYIYLIFFVINFFITFIYLQRYDLTETDNYIYALIASLPGFFGTTSILIHYCSFKTVYSKPDILYKSIWN